MREPGMSNFAFGLLLVGLGIGWIGAMMYAANAGYEEPFGFDWVLAHIVLLVGAVTAAVAAFGGAP